MLTPYPSIIEKFIINPILLELTLSYTNVPTLLHCEQTCHHFNDLLRADTISTAQIWKR
ncbi:hypothetical protein HDV00_009863, partial [Rhizophlyctis rosea]